MTKFRRNDRIRTTYQHSSAGRIVRYAPIPSYENPGVVMEWYVVKFDDGTGATIHADMMNRANDTR
jgi:hypothetical protein